MATGLEIHTQVAHNAQAEILTEGAVQFLLALHRTFDATRQGLLAAREVAQARFDAGVPFDFPPETAHIRAEPSWHCAPPSPGLEDRRVEITGPTDRKMVINALNSGAKTFMADFEGIDKGIFPSSPVRLTMLFIYRCHLADLQGDDRRPGQPSRFYPQTDRL